MNVKEIQLIAKSLGLKTSKLTKAYLIHLIQKNEGNRECYATSEVNSCQQDICLWREDCLKSVKKL